MNPDRPLAPFELPAGPPAPLVTPVPPDLQPTRLPRALVAHPLAADPSGVRLWFDVMRATTAAKGGEGFTARQLARTMGDEGLQGALEALLESLASAGDVVRRGQRPPRFVGQPLDKALAAHLKRVHQDPPATPVWEAFELALLAYEDDRCQRTWGRLGEAFQLLVESYPGWPVAVVEDALGRVDRWLPRIAAVIPPVWLKEDDELVLLRWENERLHADVAALREALAAPPPALPSVEGGKKAELKKRNEELEAENESLSGQVSSLESEVLSLEAELGDAPTPPSQLLDAFLDGSGRGMLPAFLPDDEVARLRALVLDTRATRDIQRALAAKVVAVYQTPHAFPQLSFAEGAHGFETLHRARAGRYRIGYGLLRRVPTVLAIGPRENFYERLAWRLSAPG